MNSPQDSSNTGSIGHFWQLNEDSMERGYPLDTVRMEIECPIAEKDIASGSFRMWDCQSLATKSNVSGLVKEKEHLKWTRKSDGLRIICCQGRTMVEVSLPRFFGYENHCLNLMPKNALKQLLAYVSMELLPETSQIGESSLTLTRVDIAIDFPGDILALVDYYRDVKFPGGKKFASVESRTQMTWKYCGLQVKLYGKTEEVRKRLGRAYSVPKKFCRFEIQLKGAAPLAFLVEELPEGGDAQIRVPRKRSFSRAQSVSMEAVDLLRFGLDVMSLLAPPSEKVFKVRSLKDLGVLAIIRYPAMKQAALASLKGATLRRAEARANSMKFEKNGMDLVELATGMLSEEWISRRGSMFHRCRSAWRNSRKK